MKKIILAGVSLLMMINFTGCADKTFTENLGNALKTISVPNWREQEEEYKKAQAKWDEKFVFENTPEYKNKINDLKKRKGSHVMTFYRKSASHIHNAEYTKNACEHLNEENNGYKTLKEALSDGWEYVATLKEDKGYTFSNIICHCRDGIEVILKK